MLSLARRRANNCIRRLLLRDNRPVMSHEGRIRCDPTRPVVEAELSIGPLSDLFNGHGRGSAKKGELTLTQFLGEQEAALLSCRWGLLFFAWSMWFMTSRHPLRMGMVPAAPET
jgi:hypothetical protein